MKSKFMQIAGEELRERGYKLTEPRLAILDYLVKHNGHPVIQEIYEGIKRKYPGIGMATVYRTLDLFTAIGLVRVLTLKNSRLHYEINWPRDHHHHLICTACGRVIEFNNCNFKQVAAEIETVTHFTIEEHTLEAYGKCPQCDRKS